LENVQIAIAKPKANCYSWCMKLLRYVQTHSTQRELAVKLGITPVLISQWANESRPVPPERCVELEMATDGMVTRRDLRPDDWLRIWPELRPTRKPLAKTVMETGVDQTDPNCVAQNPK
jgi:DNA-binding transcriptional regulator YdaS (Cro superfamily)